MIYRPTHAIEMPEIREVIRDYYSKGYDLNKSILNQFKLIEEFKETFLSWINSGNIQINGLHRFPHIYVINGITDFIDQVIPEQRIKPVIQNGEYPAYMYKAFVCTKSKIKLDNKVNIISFPFYNDMTIHKKTNDVIFSGGVLDLAWAGNYKTQHSIDVSNSSYVLYSLNKTLGVFSLRLGVCFSKNPIRTFELYKDIPNVNISNVELATLLMNKFSTNYLYDKYHKEFKEIFLQNNITPTDSLWIGLKDSERVSIFDIIGDNYEKRQ